MRNYISHWLPLLKRSLFLFTKYLYGPHTLLSIAWGPHSLQEKSLLIFVCAKSSQYSSVFRKRCHLIIKFKVITVRISVHKHRSLVVFPLECLEKGFVIKKSPNINIIVSGRLKKRRNLAKIWLHILEILVIELWIFTVHGLIHIKQILNFSDVFGILQIPSWGKKFPSCGRLFCGLCAYNSPV